MSGVRGLVPGLQGSNLGVRGYWCRGTRVLEPVLDQGVRGYKYRGRMVLESGYEGISVWGKKILVPGLEDINAGARGC